MCNKEDPTYPTPNQSSAVESWSDMCNVEDPPYPTPHQPSAVESWNDMHNVEDPPYPPPISHQQLRVEVTCAMWRIHPTLPPLVISSWELKWHVQWGAPNLPYRTISHQQLSVEVTCAMWRTHPTLVPPLTISSWELKWHVQCWGPTLPYPPPISHQQLRVASWIKTSYCSAGIPRPRGFG